MWLKKKFTYNLNSDNVKDDYINKSQQLLHKYKVKIGDSVKLLSNKGDYNGIIMPRYESFNDDYIVIKLKSGYNIGILIENIKNITSDNSSSDNSSSDSMNVSLNNNPRIEEHSKNFIQPKENKYSCDESHTHKSLPRILILSTGGTIASKIDYRTGGVTSILNASELYEIFPEISNYASIFPEFLFNEVQRKLDSKSLVSFIRKSILCYSK